eukprot:jgi/Picsp_1/5469/NSC_02828-R1_major facilitator superfamily mfs_1
METESDERPQVRKKLDWHLIPWLFSLGVVCYLDRTNLSFAAVQLNRDLHLSCKTYGLGAGLFFVSYAAFQVPSNVILAKLGSPLWLSITIAAWGVIAASFAGINSTSSFLILRLLLGAAESGTFPGIWSHLSYFYSPRELGAAYSAVSTSTALAQIIGSPIAAAILLLDQKLGLSGWQWLFMLEGICTVFYGIALKFFLARDPEHAYFLSHDDREWLVCRQDKFGKAKSSFASQREHVVEILKDWRIWYLSIVLAAITQAMYGCVFFIPMIIHSFFYTNDMEDGQAEGVSACSSGEGNSKGGALVALLSMIPFASAAVCMVLTGKSSELHNERRFHSGVPVCLGALFLCITPLWLHFNIPWGAFISLTLAAAAIWSYHGPFMTWPAAFLERDRAALGFALMNSVGSFGGFFGPFLLGWLADLTGGYSVAMITIGLILGLGGIAIFLFPVNATAGHIHTELCAVDLSTQGPPMDSNESLETNDLETNEETKSLLYKQSLSKSS